MRDSKQILLSYIDCTFKQDIYYELAVLLLKHEKDIQRYSIEKIAQLCFVSTSTLSRFCRKLGFQNYNEFKNGFQQNYMIHNYSNEFLQQAQRDMKSAVMNRWDCISDVIHTQMDQWNLRDIDGILETIYEKETVLFLGHQFLQSLGSYFQQNLLRFQKLTYSFYQEADQLRFIEQMGDNSAAIILSADGSYHMKHSEILNLLMKKQVSIIVITQNELTPLLHYSKKSLILNGSNKNDIGKYAMLFLIDFMMLRYKILYVDKKR